MESKVVNLSVLLKQKFIREDRTWISFSSKSQYPCILLWGSAWTVFEINMIRVCFLVFGFILVVTAVFGNPINEADVDGDVGSKVGISKSSIYQATTPFSSDSTNGAMDDGQRSTTVAAKARKNVSNYHVHLYLISGIFVFQNFRNIFYHKCLT